VTKRLGVEHCVSKLIICLLFGVVNLPSVASNKPMLHGKPWLSFAVQGGDIQDQVLLQFFLAITEFGMNVQEAAEAPYFWSYQMRNSFGDHRAEPGKVLINDETPTWVRAELERMGYELNTRSKTSGPINAILIDQKQGTFQGGSSDFGEDYGISW
jgi:gamma-glutamyltranspeptidase/glutathione hydrolase